MSAMTATFLNDGAHYDALHSHLQDDISFWLHRVKDTTGSVLELACGTGRVALAMAQIGRPVVGIDTCIPYLTHAIYKSRNLDVQVKWLAADVRRFQFRCQFDLVIFPFRSVAVLLDHSDLNACFECVRRHLCPGGLFIIDAFNPPQRQDAYRRESRITYDTPYGTGSVIIDQVRSYDPTSQIEYIEFSYPLPSSDQEGSKHQLHLRHYSAEDLTSALKANRFILAEHFSSYEENPYSHESNYQILVGEAI